MTIDTIRVEIPITKSQYERVTSPFYQDNSIHLSRTNLTNQETRIIRFRGLAETDRESFHREIAWDVSGEWKDTEEVYIIVELSLPKLWQGHNIDLLHDAEAGLNKLRDTLNHSLEFKGRERLPAIRKWRIKRLDLCYAWKLPSQSIAQSLLDSLKVIKFPWKQPVIRQPSITFVGGKHSTYSAKFYLKLPEFKAHDRKEMIKRKWNLEYINHLERKAEGVLRFEVTCRWQWLKVNGLTTVKELLEPIKAIEWDESITNSDMDETQLRIASAMLLIYKLPPQNLPIKGQEFATIINDYCANNGEYFSLPPGRIRFGAVEFDYPGGGFKVRFTSKIESFLRGFLVKFVGENPSFGPAARVQQKLLEKYKPNIAANLTAFFLFVQKFGSNAAKELYGRQAFDYKKRQLKAAGVTLLEQKESVILAKDFFSSFSLGIPSDHVVNSHDNFGGQDNLLNATIRFTKLNEGESDASDLGATEGA